MKISFLLGSSGQAQSNILQFAQQDGHERAVIGYCLMAGKMRIMICLTDRSLNPKSTHMIHKSPWFKTIGFVS
jgi:hypothetical protein